MNIPFTLVGLLTTIAALAVATAPESIQTTSPELKSADATPKGAKGSIAGSIPIDAPMAERTRISIELGSARGRRPKPPRPRTPSFARPETTDGAIGINFEDLRFDPPADQPFSPAMFTARIRSLLGKRVAIRGFIYPPSALYEKGLERFILVPNDMTSAPPGFWLDDNIVVKFVPGRSTDFSVRPLTVVGKLSMKPWLVREKIMSVYRIEALSATLPSPPSSERR